MMREEGGGACERPDEGRRCRRPAGRSIQCINGALKLARRAGVLAGTSSPEFSGTPFRRHPLSAVGVLARWCRSVLLPACWPAEHPHGGLLFAGGSGLLARVPGSRGVSRPRSFPVRGPHLPPVTSLAGEIALVKNRGASRCHHGASRRTKKRRIISIAAPAIVARAVIVLVANNDEPDMRWPNQRAGAWKQVSPIATGW